MIQPFPVHIASEILDDMKQRVRNMRWPDEINGAGWEYGTNLSYIKELADYWQNEFDWRKVEKEVNAFPGFIARVDDIQIHFLYVKGRAKRTFPLIITHGWPGSFLEMIKIIPLLTGEGEFSFDLIIPSVLGFGFSQKITQPGCNSAFVADRWHRLMIMLGYDRYGAQGGDIGAGVSTWLGLKYPENVAGLHLNYIPGSFRPYIADGESLPDEMKKFQQRVGDWVAREGAYSNLHATKPATLSYALNDSPVGLCSWIVEKFNSWSDNEGNIETVFTKDELLANITLYWVTETIHSSMRIYYENRKHPLSFGKDDFVKVPVAFAKFPKELPTPPRALIEKGYNIRRWTEMSVGGHFAAMEQPVLLANDIREFFKNIN